MTVIWKPTGLAALLLLGSSALGAQEAQPPLKAVIEFVRQDLEKVITPQMEPYEPREIYVSASPGSEAAILGSELLDRPALEATGVQISERATMFRTGDRGNHIRGDGVLVEIRSVQKAREDERGGELKSMTIVFDYFVTLRMSGRNPEVCAQAWELFLIPDPDSGTWVVAKAIPRGIC
jgi:hypothetical protein